MTVQLDRLRYRDFDRSTEEAVFDNPLETAGADKVVRISKDDLPERIDDLKLQGLDAGELEWALLRANRIAEAV